MSDVQYILTFAVMLTVGLVIGNLTAGVRYQARIARYREQRTRHLYEMSKSLAVGRTPLDIVQTSEQFIRSTFHASNLILLPDEHGKLRPLTSASGMTPSTKPSRAGALTKGYLRAQGPTPCPACPIKFCRCAAPIKIRGW